MRDCFIIRLVTVLVVLFATLPAALAQADRGTITGTVIDSNGAAVPGATVTVTNQANNSSSRFGSTKWGSLNTPSIDAITEFSVFKTESGRAQSGQLAFSSKSGTKMRICWSGFITMDSGGLEMR